MWSAHIPCGWPRDQRGQLTSSAGNRSEAHAPHTPPQKRRADQQARQAENCQYLAVDHTSNQVHNGACLLQALHSL